ncbi:hypothetical protein [Amycolatopsis sp. NPDC051128]|uniref:hypothetical protein n=1 Tax=Amycolatopsis sp. NPDC051128 TaxID=3155412 RepID=UPI00341819BA
MGSAAAVGNAVFNATGIRIRDLPIALDKLITGPRSKLAQEASQTRSLTAPKANTQFIGPQRLDAPRRKATRGLCVFQAARPQAVLA